MNDDGPCAASLRGCTAVVTGASSGIGEAVALALGALGAGVALVARRADRLATLATKITADGGTALVLPADVTDHHQARAAIGAAASAFGREGIDILVNSAGVNLPGPAATASMDDWRRMLEINFGALLACTHWALPHLLRAAGSGPRGVADVVNIGSAVEHRVGPTNGVYAATKRAVGAFSESLRQEGARRRLRVSVVRPGAVATEIARHRRPETMERRYTGERLDPREIADAVGYIVTRPSNVAISQMVVRPTEQES